VANNLALSNVKTLTLAREESIMYRIQIIGILITHLIVSVSLTPEAWADEPDEQQLLNGKAFVYKLKSEKPKGRGYRLVYTVDAPLHIFWQFKTDFDNDFLLSNKYIAIHRLISRSGNVVITENKYRDVSKSRFRWQITVVSDRHRLEFVLLNPDENNHEFHFGHIQLEPLGSKTKVTQVAYFDFFGAFLWVNYPLYGGMSDFLKYNARWEQQTILERIHLYQSQDNQ
jgi:hypothetical protein